MAYEIAIDPPPPNASDLQSVSADTDRTKMLKEVAKTIMMRQSCIGSLSNAGKSLVRGSMAVPMPLPNPELNTTASDWSMHGGESRPGSSSVPPQSSSHYRQASPSSLSQGGPLDLRSPVTSRPASQSQGRKQLSPAINRSPVGSRPGSQSNARLLAGGSRPGSQSNVRLSVRPGSRSSLPPKEESVDDLISQSVELRKFLGESGRRVWELRGQLRQSELPSLKFDMGTPLATPNTGMRRSQSELAIASSNQPKFDPDVSVGDGQRGLPSGIPDHGIVIVDNAPKESVTKTRKREDRAAFAYVSRHVRFNELEDLNERIESSESYEALRAQFPKRAEQRADAVHPFHKRLGLLTDYEMRQPDGFKKAVWGPLPKEKTYTDFAPPSKANLRRTLIAGKEGSQTIEFDGRPRMLSTSTAAFDGVGKKSRRSRATTSPTGSSASRMSRTMVAPVGRVRKSSVTGFSSAVRRERSAVF